MTTTQSAIIGLDDPAARQLPLVGGKGANLAELIAAGFPVPGGFCVGTAGYLEAAAAAGLDDVLAADAPDLAGRARAALLAAPIPDATAAAVRAAYARLAGSTGATCRSRCAPRPPPRTCPPPASPASRTPTSTSSGWTRVLDAVRRCWASLWTDRAVSLPGRAPASTTDEVALVGGGAADGGRAGGRACCSPPTR